MLLSGDVPSSTKNASAKTKIKQMSQEEYMKLCKVKFESRMKQPNLSVSPRGAGTNRSAHVRG